MTGKRFSVPRRTAAAFCWIWIVAILAFYIGSFAPVLHLFAAYLRH